MKKSQQKIKLANGVEMPLFGYGSYKVTDEKIGLAAISYAIDCGYLMIDTAEYYQNHALISQAIKKSSKNRNELFLTSKIWPNDNNQEALLKRVDKILEELDTDYLDLLLVHWPKPYGIEVYKVLEKVYQAGKVRAIGVSNFNCQQLEELLKVCTISPMVNQIELHPNATRRDVVEFCQKNNIVVTSWQTLMQGEVGNIPHIQNLAQKYGVDPAAIALNWALQQNIVVIPKSVTPSRIKSNIDNLDRFSLTTKEIKFINEASTENGQRLNSEEFEARKKIS